MATDAELLALAESAVDPSTGMPIPAQPGAGTGATLGLDLSAFPVTKEPVLPVTAPNAPENVNSTLPLPEDPQAQHIDELQGQGAPLTPSAPVTTSAPLSAEGGVAALDTARQAGMTAADAKAAEGPAKASQATADADARDNLASESRVNAMEIEAQQRATETGRAKAQAIADTAQKEFQTFKFHDFWGDKTAPERFKARLFMALGEFSRDKGGPNRNVQQVNDMIEQQHKADIAELGQRYNFAKFKSEGVENFLAQRKQDLAVLQLKHAAFYKSAEEEAKAQLERNGIPVEEAETNTIVQQMRAKSEKEYAEGYGKLVDSEARRAMLGENLKLNRMRVGIEATKATRALVPTESEGNNAARGRNMALALDNLEKQGLSGYTPKDTALQKWFLNQELIEGAKENNKNVVGQIANAGRRKLPGDSSLGIPKNEFDGLDTQDAKYLGLMRQIIEPYARKQSGAAISASEWQNFATQTGLGTGEFGRQLREQAARDMMTLGGRATKQLEDSDRARGAETPGSASVNKPSSSPTTPKSIKSFADKYGL